MLPELLNWVAHPVKGVLLIGSDMDAILTEARKAAAKLLNMDMARLIAHPDYIEVEKEAGKAFINVEQAMKIVNTGTQMPVLADKKIILIKEMNKLNGEAQNKLLKLLEDCERVIIIGIATTDSLLPTINSRMERIYYHPLAFQEFMLQASEKYGTDCEILYFLTRGNISSIESCREVLLVFRKVSEALKQEDITKIFSLFHMVKEKDPDSFFSAYREYVDAFFLMAHHFFCEKQWEIIQGCYTGSYSLEEIEFLLQGIQQSLSECRMPHYNKDSFFLSLVHLNMKK